MRAFLALTGNGVLPPVVRALDTFVKSGKRAGWWEKLLEVYPFCGLSLAASLVKLKAASGSPLSLTSNGYTAADYSQGAGFGQSGSGAKYLQTGITFASLGLTSTNFSFGGLINAPDPNSPGFYFADNTAVGDATFYMSPTGQGAGGKSCSASSSGLQPRVMSGDGSHYFSMIAGVLQNRSSAVPVPSFTTSNEVLLGRRTVGGTGYYLPAKLGLTFIGASLTEAEARMLTRDILTFEGSVRTGVANIKNGKWVFIGDSITCGQAATTVANQWTNIVAAARSKIEINLGCPSSATTFEPGSPGGWAVSLQNRFEDVLLLDAEKIFLMYGTNDCGADTSTNGDAVKIAAYQSGLTAVIAAFAARLGAANVLVVSPHWDAAKNATFNGAWNAAMAAAASAGGVTFIDYYTVYAAQADPSLLRQDSVHPNNAGMALIGSTVLGFV